VPAMNPMPRHLSTGLAPPPAGAPSAGTLDDVTRVRLRRQWQSYFGEPALLDAHLNLPGHFFGLVRHVVRTQLGEPPPPLDLEGWIEAARPSEPALAAIWDRVREHLYAYAWLDQHPVTPRSADVPAAVERVDRLIRDWPAEALDVFVVSYASLEQVLERRAALPPIDS
jgi:hypothetical protein